MIVETIGTIFLCLVGIIIFIILIPIIIALWFFFTINKGNSKGSFWESMKTFIANLVSSFTKKSPPTKSKVVKDKKGNKVEDAEFRELE